MKRHLILKQTKQRGSKCQSSIATVHNIPKTRYTKLKKKKRKNVQVFYQIKIGFFTDDVKDLRRRRDDPKREHLEGHDAGEEEEDDGHQHRHHLTSRSQHGGAFGQHL